MRKNDTGLSQFVIDSSEEKISADEREKAGFDQMYLTF